MAISALLRRGLTSPEWKEGGYDGFGSIRDQVEPAASPGIAKKWNGTILASASSRPATLDLVRPISQLSRPKHAGPMLCGTNPAGARLSQPRCPVTRLRPSQLSWFLLRCRCQPARAVEPQANISRTCRIGWADCRPMPRRAAARRNSMNGWPSEPRKRRGRSSSSNSQSSLRGLRLPGPSWPAAKFARGL